jgi:nucleoside-diphosphate-sugar epimerase
VADLLHDRAVTHKLTHAGLLCSVEQRPDPESRIRLSHRRDRLGLPIAQIDWRINKQEKASVARLGTLIRQESVRLGLPAPALVPWIREGHYERAEFADVAHPTGTTRMGHDPRESVVDENCQVHGVSGLFVAGSSVFPTAGHANPTLMIVALAARLADRLRAQLKDDHYMRQVGEGIMTHAGAGGPVTRALADAEAISLEGAKVAVTGATGFIGSRLAEKLLERGVSVTCLVRGEVAASARLAALPVTLRSLDLSDEKAVENATEGSGVVFHCAYDWHSEPWNVAAIRALISGCVRHRVRRFVHVSTFSVYEQPAAGKFNEQTPLTNARSGYAGNKLQLEQEVLQAVLERGLAATILQPTIVYGPFSRPWTIDPADMLLNGTVVLPGQGEGFCNALFVDDLVEALILAAIRPEAEGERFIVSGPEVITWNRFYETIAAAIGAPGPEYRPAEAIARSNSGLAGKLRRLANPALAARLAVRLSRAGPVVESGLRFLSPAQRERARAHIFGPLTRRPGHVHIPNMGQLSFFEATAMVDAGKIRRLLGFQPRFDWASGMQATAGFLADRYGRKNLRAV